MTMTWDDGMSGCGACDNLGTPQCADSCAWYGRRAAAAKRQASKSRPRRLAFVLSCVPTAQARARHGVVNGHSVTYKAGAQRANEQTLDALLAPVAPKKPLEGPVRLEFVAVFPVPASATKKAREAMLRGQTGHIHKPDLDNLAKQLKDAMSRLQFWGDDRQVTSLMCSKRYGEIGRWEVCVREIHEGEVV